jgi:hypothetical protein
MGIKIFSDMIDAFDKVVEDIVKIKNLTKQQREHYREVISNTFNIFDQALLLVISRLRTLADIKVEDKFAEELGKLNYDIEWLDIERKIRLCDGLRAAAREMEGLWNRFSGKISTKNWEAFNQKVNSMLTVGEAELASFISRSLDHLAAMSSSISDSQLNFKKAKTAVQETTDALKKERDTLITAELKFKNLI